QEDRPSPRALFFKAPDFLSLSQLCGSRSAIGVSAISYDSRNTVDLLLKSRSSCNDSTGIPASKKLRFDNLVSDSVTNELTHRVNFKLAHNVRAVGFRRLHADAENRRDFLAGFSFGKKLDDFTLTGRQ